MVSIRLVAPAIALAALLTGAVFMVARGQQVVVLSFVSVVVIAASLYLMLGPGERGHAGITE
jgi:hypothetical protein